MITRSDLPCPVREIEHVWIPMSDGVRLSARIWLPEGAESEPVPAILEYIPYRKRDGTRPGDDPRHAWWAGHGYACVRLDIRGTGESEGLIHDEYALQEQDDAVEAIAWLAAQPWCSGKVGMTGISWGGFNSLQVAARRPPALAAIITHCSTDDRYADDVHYMGGCHLLANFYWGTAFFHFMSRPRDPLLAGESWREDWLARLAATDLAAGEIWLRHQHRDEYWEHGSVCERYEDIECAVYAVGGWEDGYSNAVPRLLANLHCPRKGLVGPWGHKYPHEGIPGPAIGFLQDGLRWWDHWLKGRHNDVMEEPVYRVWMQEYVPPEACLQHIPGRWVAEDAWPAPRIDQQTLHLGEHRLLAQPGPDATLTHRSPQTVGLAGGEWCPYGLGGESPDLAVNQHDDDARSLSFDGEVLDQGFEILGAPVATLDLGVDQPQALLAVRLCDIAPDGTSRRVSYGLLNLGHRDGHAAPAPLVPGERYRIRVVMNDVAYAFAPGHRLRLAISTSYWPMVWPSPHAVTLSLHTGGSLLSLPRREPRAEDAALSAFAPPEQAPPPPARVIRPAASARHVSHDLASGETRVHYLEDGGAQHIEPIDMDVADGMVIDYSIRGDDPLSTRAVYEWNSERARGDWRIRLRSRVTLSCDAHNYHVSAEQDAYENERRVHSRDWQFSVSRYGS